LSHALHAGPFSVIGSPGSETLKKTSEVVKPREFGRDEDVRRPDVVDLRETKKASREFLRASAFSHHSVGLFRFTLL
jgi:hypothetical protein